jgi:hypothetical protein
MSMCRNKKGQLKKGWTIGKGGRCVRAKGKSKRRRRRR